MHAAAEVPGGLFLLQEVVEWSGFATVLGSLGREQGKVGWKYRTLPSPVWGQTENEPY